MGRKQPGKDFVLGAMIGSTLGALTAIMFGTKKGDQIQKELMKKYHELEGAVSEYATSKQRKAKAKFRKIAKEADQEINRVSRKIKKKLTSK